MIRYLLLARRETPGKIERDGAALVAQGALPGELLGAYRRLLGALPGRIAAPTRGTTLLEGVPVIAHSKARGAALGAMVDHFEARQGGSAAVLQALASEVDWPSVETMDPETGEVAETRDAGVWQIAVLRLGAKDRATREPGTRPEAPCSPRPRREYRPPSAGVEVLRRR